jgi:cytochrome c biogenesis protein CcmG/thiol:disulfide interchange protein DsbE
MNRLFMILPPLLFAGLALVFWLGMQRDNPDMLPSVAEGKVVPPVTLTDAGFTEADLKKPGVKLVNFWASWCAPCRAEHPVLMGLQAQGVPVYGVNYKDEPAKAGAFLAELGNPFTAIGSDNGRMGLDWGLYGVPETFLIDGEGKVLLRFAGPLVGSDYEQRFIPALKAALGQE